MIASDAANDNDFWSYQAAVPTNITLSRRSMLKGIPMHDLERRALLHVIPDPRFHPALVIHRADRLGVFEGMPLSRLKLRPSYAYLQPPGSNTPEFPRSEEHTSELQSLMRISYAVFCLKKKIKTRNITKLN